MTNEEKKRIGNKWLELAKFFGRDLSLEAVVMAVNVLDDLDANKIEKVMDDWFRESPLQRHPSPAEIRDKVCPSITPRTQAVDISSRIIASVAKFGWANPRDAREYIGEAGWAAMERLGGWQYVCENLGNNLPLTTVQAQLRDVCEAMTTIEIANEYYNNERTVPIAGRSPAALTPATEIIERLTKKEIE